LVVQRRLRDRPRVRRPWVIELKIRLGRRLHQGRREIMLAQGERRSKVAAVCRRPRRCTAARINRELRIGSAHQEAWRWARKLLGHLLPARAIGKPGMKHGRRGMTGTGRRHVRQIDEAERVHAMDIVSVFQRRSEGDPRDPDLLWLSGHPLAEDQNQQSAGADHERDQAQNPRRRRFSRRSVLSQPGGSATTAHRRNNVVGQMLHEYATTLSTAAI
jgi:hypothetical protein